MRQHPLKWFFVLLLCAAGVWFLIYENHLLKIKTSSAASAASAASQTSASNAASPNAVMAAAAAAKTNKFAWRLSNTTRPIKQLIHDPRAILLENALIDTGAKLNLSIPKNLQSQGDPGAYIVQAHGSISVAFRYLLANAGASIVSYIPNNAYLVRASEAVADGLAANPLVQAVIPYEPYYKVQSPLLAMAQQALPPETQLNLALFPDDKAATLQQIQQLGGHVLAMEDSLAGYPVVKVEPPANWTAIAALPGVHIVEPFYRRTIANDLARPALEVSANSVTPTNYMNLYGSNVIVEVDDTGIDTNHPDLNNSQPLSWAPFHVLYNDPNMGVDTDGHGTHVAGIIAGDGFESETVTNAAGSIMPGTNFQFRGKAPFAQMFSMNYLDPDEELQETAATNGALISNNSWTYGDFDYDLAAASYDAATRDALPTTTGSQPVLFVFPSGNDGNTAGTVLSPGTAKDIMTVGALEELRFITNQVTNADGTLSQPWLAETENSNTVPDFSSCGNVDIGIEGTFGRFKPDVVASGTFVVSCRSTEWDTNAYYNPTNNTYYDFPDFIPTNSVSVAPFQFFVPSNTVDVIFYTVTNIDSSGPTLPPIPIYLSTNSSAFGYIGTNFVVLGPDPTTLDEDWSVEASNVTVLPLAYDLIVDVQTTNNLGNYYQVLEGLNNNLCKPDQSGNLDYRYESGTSMSAAAISGFLALIQDYFTNQFSTPFIPSPALLKTMTINGARSMPGYDFQVNNNINFQGWGQPGLSNSIPIGLTNLPMASSVNVPGPLCSTYFREQSSSNALATGDQETFIVNLNTNNSFGNYLPLRITLGWTDPPGDPAAALKLVNSLELVVTDLDEPSIVYYGNDIGSGQVFNTPESATNAPIIDTINNIQNIYLQPFTLTNTQPDSDYSVTVIGRSVNVNAVSANTNNDVQDFALVISAGDMGEISNAFMVTDQGILSNPTGDQNITIGQTNTILLNQIAGANTPLLGSNTVVFTTNTVAYSTNGQFTIGMTNQWHFYVITNSTAFTNAAFITFGAATLSIPRMGVFANSDENSTTPGADLDLLVSVWPNDQNASNLLILDPNTVSNCVNGVGDDGASLVSGGTDFVAYTNAVQDQVYYVGVKSESHMAAVYGFIPIFTDIPFSQLDQNGNEYLNGLNVPSPIPDGTPSRPGVSYVFSLALSPIVIQNVIVTNVILHQNFGDLVGSLTHGNQSVVLNSHDSLVNPPGPYKLIYDDSQQGDVIGSQTSDGPGTLRNFQGATGEGVWQLTEEGTALGQTGEVLNTTTFLQKYQDPTRGITITIQPGQWFYTFLDVPSGYTNLELYGSVTNVFPGGQLPMRMYLNTGGNPTATTFLFEADLTNAPPAPLPFPTFAGPWNIISDGPPLQSEIYYIGVFNPGTVAETVYLQVLLNGPQAPPQPTLFSSTNASPISVDAVTNTSIFVSNSNVIESVNVGMVVQYPRISDLAFTLISPSGQRILLMENRGGPASTNAGGVFFITNSFGNVTADGTSIANTNYINTGVNSGTLSISYDFFTVPDEMTVYYGTNSANFFIGSPDFLFDTGMTNNAATITIPFGPGASSYVTVIMNQFGNTNGPDAWTYTINGSLPDFNYLTFTDDTNLTVTPIKFAIPPFDLRDLGTNFVFDDLDLATNGDYFSQTNIYDPFGGWTVATNLVTQVTNGVVFTNNYNEVSVVSDPSTAFQGSTNISTNYLALGYGVIQRTNLVTPFRMVTVSYEYRGPGIAGWWRGEGDARDSSDAEQRGQNGSLIGRFDFPVGEVSQSFEMENNGQEYDFAGTNGYVQIRQQPISTEVSTNGGTNFETIQSSYLDVGTGPGFTVEGWINPTNVGFQQPLVEWLARVPTNGSDTNLNILAGPYLDRGTDNYYYLLAATNWTTSETWAEELGGHLATVDTADEQNWIYDTFASYRGRNHNLWIGLTNFQQGAFGYAGGLTNISYTNWLTLQPTNCDNTRNYTLMLGSTNTYPGLWALANNQGIMCGPITNIVYGVVEVTNLQTNGVQFWISVTNVPGTTNLINVTNGCLFANIMDTTNGSHWIYSGPNLIQSNVFQHVALTYDTNSGIANLFYNGTNVASTNMGVFIPNTTGDVLLGKDMSLQTNNYYGGLMDEMSIYDRALSDAEITGIYSVSAFSTNRLIGKFDPAITPPLSLAEAQVVLGNMTNTILGENNTWQQGSFSFTSQTNALPMQISGIEPGMLFDEFSVSQAPLGNLYYLPEQSISDELKGQSANGAWTLEIWNTRNNTLATNAEILSWQLQMILQTNTPPVIPVGPQEPTTVTVLPGQTVTLRVPVPIWALTANNVLDFSTQPLNVFFNPTNPPVGVQPVPDTFMFGPATTGSELLNTLVANYPTNIVPGGTYYIGLQNTSSQAARATFEVDFNVTALTNDVPFNDTLVTNTSLRYFSFTVSTNNPYEATFQLLNMSGDADLVVSKGLPLPTLTSSSYGSFNSGKANENIYILTNSMPVPLTPGTWYLGVFNRDTHAVNYTVLAQELDLPPLVASPTNLTIIPLTNGVPFDFTQGPGAALTNFFSFLVTNTWTLTNGPTITNYVPSLHFELYNLTGNGDLTVQSNLPPFAPPFFQSSQEPGTIPELIQITTNSALTNLAATWYLGVPNESTNLIHFTILAVIDTNSIFPAFPGAEGAGGGALGGSFRNGYTNNTVYHVNNLYDAGPGSLRDAVSSTNRTIVFDISGIIYLQTPLVITNSYLTIAGQTAPEGGITIADASVIVSSGAHDVIIRYVRFRPLFMAPQPDLFFGNYYSGNIIDLATNGAVVVGSGLNYPTGLVFDNAGNLFEADQFSGNIFEYPVGGGPRITFATGLNQPSQMAFNAANDLFVNTADNAIYKFTPQGVKSTFVSGLSGSGGLTFGKEGDLFIGTSTNGAASGSILKITPNGVETVYASGFSPAPTAGLVFDRYGNLFTGHTGASFITEISRGKVITTFASALNQNCAMAFDNADDMYVADQGPNPASGDIPEIAPNGTILNDNTASYVDHPVSVTFGGPATTFIEGGAGGNALQFINASNVIADHVSAIWSSNADLSILDCTNITVQWSMLADTIPAKANINGVGSVVDTLSPLTPAGGTITLSHNLYADNAYGNPQLGGNNSLDFVNNVVYDWGTNAGISDIDNPPNYTNYLNYRCNYLIASPTSLTNNVAFWGGTTNTWIFQTNNFIDSNTNGILDGANTHWGMFTNVYTKTNQFMLPPVSVDEAYLAYEKDLDFAGVSMFKREPAETNIVENVRRQAGTIITTPGALPTLSSDLIFVDSANDGIPDFWKITFGQAVTNAENNFALDSSGYSELEEFDNWLAGPHALTMTNAPVGVDLQKLFGKTGNLSFFATNAIHGTVYLTNVLGSYTNQGTYSNSIAIFTPTNGAVGATNYSGYASFDVYVTNTDTVAYFPVTISVFVSAVPPTYSEQAGYLTQAIPITNSIAANTTIWYLISVPTNAVQATNTLLFAGAPMNLWYSSNTPPTTVYPADFDLLPNSTNGSAVINAGGSPLPPVLQPGDVYYLGVQNTNNFATNYAVEVTFDTVPLPPGIIIINPGQPVTNVIPAAAVSPGGIISPADSPGGLPAGANPTYYGIFVPPNAIAATNTLLFATGGSASVWFNQNSEPLTGASGDFELITNYNGTTPDSAILTLTGVPPLVTNELYIIAITNTSSTTPLTNAFEVTFDLFFTPPILPTVTNVLISAGNTLTVNDTGSDTNAGSLNYYLTTAPPVNATVSGSGIITWAVPINTPAENVLFTEIVSNAFTTVTATNSFTVTVMPLLTVGQPQTNNVPSNSVVWLTVDVPRDADWATNTLLYATNLPVNVLFTTNSSPSVATANVLMANAVNGTSVLGTGTVPTNIVSGGVYYIGIQNNNSVSIGYAFQVTFGLYSPPVLPVISNQIVVPGGSLTVTNTATDTNSGTLFYTLATSPSVSAAISSGGVVTWAVPTHQALGDILFETVVTNSLTTLSATNYFTVSVVRPAPFSIGGIVYTNIGGTNGYLLTWYAPTNDYFQVQQTPSIVPPVVWTSFTNIITYNGPLTPTNGRFTFFDTGSQFPFGPTRDYRILLVLKPLPNALLLPNQTNYVLSVSEPLTVDNTAADSDPAAILDYTLAELPPPATNATISANGIINWTPGPADAGSAFTFTTTVTDDGLPPATATNAFTVFVLPPPSITTAIATSTNLTMQWTASSNDLFQVQWTTNLAPNVVWQTYPRVVSSVTNSFTFTDTNAPTTMKFYRLLWVP